MERRAGETSRFDTRPQTSGPWSVTTDRLPSLISGRFELVRRLGEGGMGVVYEAFDRDRRARVAIKTLRTFSAVALARFKREFRALQDLQHPNLITLGELISDGEQWFFTMELGRGDDILAFVRGHGIDSLAVGTAETLDTELKRMPSDAPPRRR